MKLRYKVLAIGTLMLGMSVVPNMKVKAELKATDIQVDLNNENLLISDKTIFYTEKANARNSIPKSNLWVRANYTTTSCSAINFSNYKNKTIYLSETPSPISADEILAITIPARPSLKVKLLSQTEDVFKTSGTGAFSIKGGMGKSIVELKSYDNIEVKMIASNDWTAFSEFFTSNKLEKLMKKGATLYFRNAPSKDTIKFVQYTDSLAKKDIEKIKYKFNNEAARASAFAKVSISKKKDAPKINIGYGNFTLSVSENMQIAKLNSLDDMQINWTVPTNTKYSFTPSTENELFYAVRTAQSGKKAASNITYITIPKQNIIDASKISVTRSIASNPAITINDLAGEKYEYLIANSLATNIEKATWTEIKIPKENTIKVTIKKAKLVDDNKAVYIRKKADSKSKILASTWIKYIPSSVQTEDNWTIQKQV